MTMRMKADLIAPMPVLSSVEAVRPFVVRVTWGEGLRAGKTEMVDLGPVIEAYKFYRPLRVTEGLFGDIQLRDGGLTIGWGDVDAELEIPTTNVERLAEECMTADDFRDFLRATGLTHAQAAAALGRSRRQIENYLAGEPIPRIVGLACFGYQARINRTGT